MGDRRDNLTANQATLNLISNFPRVLNVIFFLFGDSLASEFSVPTFRNTLFHLRMSFRQEEFSRLNSKILHVETIMKMEHSVPKRLHRKLDAGESPKRKNTTTLSLLQY
jgi:hypothetical protein